MRIISTNAYRMVLATSSVVGVSVITAALLAGQMHIPVGEVFSALATMLRAQTELSSTYSIVADIRAPRIIAAFTVGAALAAAGAAYQNLFRNPLVSPDILGVSSGAALGAVLAIFLAVPVQAVAGFAFAGGLAAVAAIYFIGNRLASKPGAHDPVLTLVLAGVVIGSLLGSGIALTKYLADPYNQLPAITYWLLGSFAGVTRNDLSVALPVILLATLPLIALRWRINLLALPDDEARALGQDTGRLRLVVIVCATLMTAASVAICGIVGWVGLVVPHAVRLLVGAEFSRLLPVSMLLGGTFMLVVDTIGRSVAQIEIPPGVLTAAIGTPVFLWLMAASFRQPR